MFFSLKSSSTFTCDVFSFYINNIALYDDFSHENDRQSEVDSSSEVCDEVGVSQIWRRFQSVELCGVQLFLQI